MRVLFVPAQGIAAIGHGIPLLALNRQLDSSFVPAFLVPKPYWDFFRHRGANVLDVDHDDLKTQMIAHALFKPDIVVDDFSFTTAFARQLTPFPRVTIQRTGSFPGEKAPTVGREHSAEPAFRALPDLSWMGLPKPSRITDLLEADAFIVPGIPSVDVLPAQLRDDPRFCFSGPLLVDDSPTVQGSPPSPDVAVVEAFLERHAGRQIVLFTFGTITGALGLIQEQIGRLLKQGHAVVSTVAVESAACDRGDLFLHRPFLPLNRICARASLLIHHCGAGTAQYPILFNLPSITVSTGRHERDELALRLQAQGASIHLDPTVEQSGFDARFDEAVRAYLDPTSEVLRSARAALSRLKQEADMTTRSFDFPGVLERARNARTRVRPRANATWHTPRGRSPSSKQV
jgi:UDP:flavonoid glycosyltransferase YjiC (YdhE family)